MKKALPLKLWLELEDSVAHHKAEIARQFAEARALLLPEPPKPAARNWNDEQARWQMEMAAKGYQHAFTDPRTGATIWQGAQDYYERRGLFGLGILGL